HVTIAATDSLNIEIGDEGRIFLNEIKPGFRLGAHQPINADAGGVQIVTNLDLQQGATLWRHGGLAQMGEWHLTEALEARDVDLALAGELGFHQLEAMRVIAGIEGLAALADTIERRQCQEQVSAVDQLGHFLKEERSEEHTSELQSR